ncbi:MAG: rhodanese-like domain-containing protein [Helicobacteraceae bacterium]|jgi:rhodanese-related sulfurtransferase|nr:rhodanese-like domain-containing protein [Helicobacteraceae bacterium]
MAKNILEQDFVTSAELVSLLEARSGGEADFVLIDVREKYEAAHHFIEGTDLVISYNSFYPKVKKIKEKEPLYILYCANGSRSKVCAETMREIGYKNAKNLDRGIDKFKGKIIYRDSKNEI